MYLFLLEVLVLDEHPIFLQLERQLLRSDGVIVSHVLTLTIIDHATGRAVHLSVVLLCLVHLVA